MNRKLAQTCASLLRGSNSKLAQASFAGLLKACGKLAASMLEKLAILVWVFLSQTLYFALIDTRIKLFRYPPQYRERCG
jgi:hypothetical protein